MRKFFLLTIGLILPLVGQASSAVIAAEDFDLQSYQGQVVYLDFWASWCGPCRDSFPWMQSMQQRYADQGLQVLAINVDEDRQAMQEFLQAHTASFPIVHDPDGQIAERYALKGMPSSFLLDREGQLILRHNGFRQKDKQALESKIQQAISQPVSGSQP